MKQTDMWHGMICYVLNSSGEVYENSQMVEIAEVGVKSSDYAERADSSRVYLLQKRGGEGEDAGVLDKVLVPDNEFTRRTKPDEIGKPTTKVMKNRKLISLREGQRQIEKREEERRKQQERVEMMEQARNDMTYLLTEHGILFDDVHVSARFDHDAEAAEVTSVRITGESIERMIQVFVNYKKHEQKPE